MKNSVNKYILCATALTASLGFAQDASKKNASGAFVMGWDPATKEIWNHQDRPAGTLVTLAQMRNFAAIDTIAGRVVDAHTLAPLPGVQIQAYNDPRFAAMTDANGCYKMAVPGYVRSIFVRYEGYGSQQVALLQRANNVDVRLYSDAFSAQYKPQTTTTRAVDAPINDRVTDVSVDDQIVGELGAQVRGVIRSANPGSGAFMLLNGINSLHANAQPLVVIDGIIMDMQYNCTTLHEGLYNNILANVSVDDIADVTVLRNGTAIYGAKGANGVILINTKRAQSQVTKIDVSLGARYEQVPQLPDVMNASQYRTYVSEMLGTTGTKITNFKFLRDEPSYYYYNMYHNDTDWSKKVYREALSQTYSINVQGGDDIASYNLSVGYAASDATLRNTSYDRFNLRLNSDIKLTDHMTVRFDASYSDVNRNMRDMGLPNDVTDETLFAPSFLSLVKSPFLSPYSYDTQGNITKFLADADDYLDEVIGADASLGNPLSIQTNGEAKNKNSFGNRLITLSIAPRYEFKHGLALTENFSFVMLNTDENYYVPVTGMPRYEVDALGYVHNHVQSMASHQYLTTSDTRLEWNQQWDESKLNLYGGFRYNLSSYEFNGMEGYDSGNDKSPNMNTGLNYKSTYGTDEKVTTLTYYLMGHYNWRETYYLTAGMSMETSSRFGKEADGLKMAGVVWGLFPSVTASYVMSNEPWFPELNWVDYLKFNAGFDISGNDDIDLTASRTYFTASKLLNAVDGTVVGNIGNEGLKWESTKRFTAGADLNLFSNRLSLSANYFTSHTSDLLSMQHLNYVTGLTRNWCNGGKLKNNGFDVTASVKALNLKNWKWEVGASIGHYKNEVTKLPGNDAIETSMYGGTILTQVGSPVGLFYGYKTNGVYATTADAQADGYYQVNKKGIKEYFGAGDMKFVNTDASSQEINEKDRVVIGDPNPDFYGNIFSNLRYRNWTLGVVFNYAVGNDLYNYQRSVLEGGSYFYNQTTAMTGRWMAEGQNTSIPKIYYEDPMGNARFSDRWIEDGSFLRLKNVTLSYDFDFDSRYLQGVTLWGSANNLFTLTKYLGSDPEFSCSNSVLLQGIDRGLLPTSRNFSVGLKIHL